MISAMVPQKIFWRIIAWFEICLENLMAQDLVILGREVVDGLEVNLAS